MRRKEEGGGRAKGRGGVEKTVCARGSKATESSTDGLALGKTCQ